MSTNKSKRKSLLTYWTTRYLITLCVGLVVFGVSTSLWLNYSEKERRLDVLRFMAAEISDRIVDDNGHIQIGPFLTPIFDRQRKFLQFNGQPFLLILDQNNNVLFNSLPSKMPQELLVDVTTKLNEEDGDQLTLKRGEKIYVVKRKLEHNNLTIGWVVLMSPEKEIYKVRDSQFLFIMLGALALLGWIIIYLLTKKLAKPIKGVAHAAKEIVAGNYDIHLEPNSKEKEIFELIHSFKDMADRLGQLERMRTELLAGVTHELKTPVTSISGLIQAVRDGIVTGEEAEEFLDICAKETSKLHKMVEDLLDFNSFAVGDVKIQKEEQNINTLIQEITHQWLIVQEENSITLRKQFPDHSIVAVTDPLRVQQILYNLLNNAKQASKENGVIEISLYETDNEIRINVKDNGVGIPEEEQSMIFEKFFRGEEKKLKVRGLGLGLPFSRLLAQALGGNLLLQESVKSSTTFTLILPK
ncbi:ATP-binding protein [Brevibacillus sp. B_LB10_24]|uniref:HAMP domain-containing sensor histidine kinase n=1 Tax=Brevibacillus sp. B_LB10_24 TaxID=3380645 RepID=UPI0038BC832F